VKKKEIRRTGLETEVRNKIGKMRFEKYIS